MEAWQTLLIHLYKEGRQWVSQLDRGEWRRKIAETRGAQIEPPLQIIQTDTEAQGWIRSSTTLQNETRKGFVIAPDRNNAETLMLLAPFPLSNGQTPKLSLQLGIMLNDGQNKSFFGYRFESPEGFDEHNYYHAQPIQSFGRGRKSSHSIPWYPDRYPSFPIDATNGVELVASVLLSYWKWQRLNDLATSSAIGNAVKTPLRAYLDRIKNTGK